MSVIGGEAAVSVDELPQVGEFGRAAPRPAAAPGRRVLPVAPGSLWPRRFVIVVAMGISSGVLAGWLGYLVVALPGSAMAGWRATWIGFDVVELGSFALTGWAAWKYRPVLVLALFGSAMLLLADAWFDVALSWRTGGFVTSVVLAAVVEIPLAVALLVASVRVRRSVIEAVRLAVGLDRNPLRPPTLFDPLALRPAGEAFGTPPPHSHALEILGLRRL